MVVLHFAREVRLPETNLQGATFVGAAASQDSPVRQLFGGGLFVGTLLLWLAFFMSLLVVYLLTNWMPTLIQQASGASLAGAAFMWRWLHGASQTWAIAFTSGDAAILSPSRSRYAWAAGPA